MMSRLSAITFKSDPVLLGFAALLVGVVAFLVYTGHVSFKEAAAFVLGALALPGLFGAKDVATAETEIATKETMLPPPEDKP